MLIAARSLIVIGPQTLASERRALSRGTETGLFHRVRRGVYLPAAEWNTADERTRGLVRIAALAAVSSDPPVFSHWSAALALRLPVPFPRMTTVHRSAAAGSIPTQPDVLTHRAAVAPQDVVEIDGLLFTGIARTAADLAAATAFDHGVMVADAALRMLALPAEHGRQRILDAWPEPACRAAPARSRR